MVKMGENGTTWFRTNTGDKRGTWNSLNMDLFGIKFERYLSRSTLLNNRSKKKRINGLIYIANREYRLTVRVYNYLIDSQDK